METIKTLISGNVVFVSIGIVYLVGVFIYAIFVNYSVAKEKKMDAGIIILGSILCLPITSFYVLAFPNKSTDKNDIQSTIDVDSSWECPRCEHKNPNTIYVCEQCKYKLQ